MPAVTSGELLLEQVMREFKAASESERKLDVERRIAHYHDDYKTYIESVLKTNFATDPFRWMKPLIDDSINVVKFVVNQQYTLYRREAERYADTEGADTHDERFNQIVESMQYNAIMDKAQKLAGIATGCALYVVPEMETGELRIDICTPDDITVVQDAMNPSEALAIIYEVDLEDTDFSPIVQKTPVSNMVGNRLQYFVYWDVFGRHFMFDSNLRTLEIKNNPKNENPFKDPERPGRTILPFVICTPSYVPGAIWDKTTGKNLVSANEQIAISGTLLNYYTKMQSFKQLYVSGSVDVKITDDMLLDPGTVWKIIGEGANVGVLDLQNNLEAFSRILDAKIERALNQEGLALSDFKQTGTAASGYALRVKRIPLEEKRIEQMALWKKYEEELFEVIRIVNNTMFPSNKINEAAEFEINFGKIDEMDSPTEQVQRDTWDIQNGVRSIVEIMAERFGISEDEALIRYQKNMAMKNSAMTQAMVPATQGLGSALAAITERSDREDVAN